MWGRYGTIVASMQLGRTPPLLTVPSLSDCLSHSPPTSSSSLHFYTHHPLSYVLLISFQHMPVPSRILRSGTFFEISPTFVLPLISFLIVSKLVTPHIHRNIFISATSIFFSCAYFTALVSAPYTVAGLTIVL